MRIKYSIPVSLHFSVILEYVKAHVYTPKHAMGMNLCSKSSAKHHIESGVSQLLQPEIAQKCVSFPWLKKKEEKNIR